MAVSEIYGRPANTTSIPATVSDPTDRERSQWYVLSVNDLYGKDGDYLRFLNFTPVKIIGYTTYVYHVSHGDIDRVKERSPPKKQTRDPNEPICSVKANGGFAIAAR
jgi:hypothetical protein